jgi:hypothetical protein
MGYNSYSRQRARQVLPQAPASSSISTIADAITTVEKIGTTATNVASYVKPANRNLIGLVGLAAISYWLYTRK